MPTMHVCPECGQSFREDGTCPACLCDLLPDALHRQRTSTYPQFPSIELTHEQAQIDHMMRTNRGLATR